MNKKDILFYLAIFILVAVFIMSILAPWLSPFDPNQIDMQNKLKAPSKEFLLGTDLLGRDILSRIIHGGRVSIALAILATFLSMSFGLLVGVFAGYFGGKVDAIINVILNIFQGLPSICFILAIIGVIGTGEESLILALVITSWAGFARIVRTETLKVRKEDFITTLKCFGASSFRIIFLHVIPNIIPNISVLFATRLGRSILTISALSYLGLGIKPPTPDWSVMISDAKMNYRSNPHLIIIPGICIFLVLFAINTIGDYLRDKTDIKTMEIQ